MRDWTVAVAQCSKFACYKSTVYLKMWMYNNLILDMFTHLINQDINI